VLLSQKKPDLPLRVKRGKNVVPPSVRGHVPTRVSRCEPSGWNRDVSPQPWSPKPVVYWCCQSRCSDRYHLPQMGLRHADSKLRSGNVEGYGTFSRYELPERPRPFVTPSFSSSSPGWPVRIGSTGGGVCESPAWDRYTWTKQGGTDPVWRPHLSPLGAASTASPRVSGSPLSTLLWPRVVSVVSNKEEILVPSWPAHRGHRRIYGVCLLYWGCFWTERDINNTSPSSPELRWLLFHGVVKWLYWMQDVNTQCCFSHDAVK